MACMTCSTYLEKKTNAVLLRLLVKGIQTRYSDYKGTKSTALSLFP